MKVPRSLFCLASIILSFCGSTRADFPDDFAATYEQDAAGIWVTFPTRAGYHYRIMQSTGQLVENPPPAVEEPQFLYTAAPSGFFYGDGQSKRHFAFNPPPAEGPLEPIDTVSRNFSITADATPGSDLIQIVPTYAHQPWALVLHRPLPHNRAFASVYWEEAATETANRKVYHISADVLPGPVAAINSQAYVPSPLGGYVQVTAVGSPASLSAAAQADIALLESCWPQIVGQFSPPTGYQPGTPPPYVQPPNRRLYKVVEETLDSDSDGIPNHTELAFGLNAFSADSDGDGYMDSTPDSDSSDSDGDRVPNNVDAVPYDANLCFARIPDTRYVPIELGDGQAVYLSDAGHVIRVKWRAEGETGPDEWFIHMPDGTQHPIANPTDLAAAHGEDSLPQETKWKAVLHTVHGVTNDGRVVLTSNLARMPTNESVAFISEAMRYFVWTPPPAGPNGEGLFEKVQTNLHGWRSVLPTQGGEPGDEDRLVSCLSGLAPGLDPFLMDPRVCAAGTVFGASESWITFPASGSDVIEGQCVLPGALYWHTPPYSPLTRFDGFNYTETPALPDPPELDISWTSTVGSTWRACSRSGLRAIEANFSGADDAGDLVANGWSLRAADQGQLTSLDGQYPDPFPVSPYWRTRWPDGGGPSDPFASVSPQFAIADMERQAPPPGTGPVEPYSKGELVLCEDYKMRVRTPGGPSAWAEHRLRNGPADHTGADIVAYNINRRGQVLAHPRLIWQNGRLLKFPDLVDWPRDSAGNVIGEIRTETPVPIAINDHGAICGKVKKLGHEENESTAVLWLPAESAPAVLPVNSDFDEGRVDPVTGLAIPDCEDENIALEAERNHLDGIYEQYQRITEDMHNGWFGVLPESMPSAFWDGATITIEKVIRTDPETSFPESGLVRFYAKWGDDAYQYYGIVPYDPEVNPSTVNLVEAGINGRAGEGVYGSSSQIPAHARFYMEGVKPGKITLEWRYQKGSRDIKHRQSFLVSTQKPRSKWLQEVYYQIRLQTVARTGTEVNLTQYNTNGGFWNEETSNEKYVQAMYYYYRQLFQQMPEKFMWAGMAKVAAAPIYAGMSDLTEWYFGSELTPGQGFGTRDSGTFLFIHSLLLNGQKHIFDDMSWAHRAYQASGIWAIRSAVLVNDRVTNLDAWEILNEGARFSNPQQIDSGNRDLLQREQRDVVQNDYNNLKSIWLRQPPAVAAWWFDATTVPVNEAGLANAAEWLSANSKKNPLNPTPPHSPAFHTIVPGGKLDNYADRWAWISNPNSGMLEMWTGTSLDGPNFDAAGRMLHSNHSLRSAALPYAYDDDYLPNE